MKTSEEIDEVVSRTMEKELTAIRNAMRCCVVELIKEGLDPYDAVQVVHDRLQEIHFK